MAQFETITLGAGCFWCIEAVLTRLNGVESVQSGYMGGETENPSYEEVCQGDTGHAEVAEVRFDPTVLSLADLLRIFFTMHDPTTLNRQGADVGSQYRSVIFYHNEGQRKTAEAVIAEIEQEGLWEEPVVTAVEPAQKFYPAEEYHRQYFERNQNAPYCRVVIAPKIAKLRNVLMSQ